MANAYTDILSGVSLGTNLVQTAYDRLVEFALRAQPAFRAVVDKHPAQQAMPGSSITLQLYQDLARVTANLAETTDPDAVLVPPTQTVNITLNEYGNVSLVTRKLELFSLSDVDPAIANILAFNMLDSVDELAQTTLRGGVNIVREIGGALTSSIVSTNGGTPATIGVVGATPVGVTGTDLFVSRDVRFSVAKLRANKVMPRKDGLYWCGIHPEVSHDLRKETGSAAWRDPHVYSAPGSIWAGEIGQYEGAYFVESPRNYNATDGATATRVFRTYFAGQQALAEAVSEEPHVVIGPVVDKLMRYRPIGWYGVLGWSIYRQAAIIRVETTSSIDNV